MSMLEAVDKWHKTKIGLSVFALAELALALLFVALAENSGSLLEYTIILFLGIGILQNTGKLIRTSLHGK
jgi:hypothetical protein